MTPSWTRPPEQPAPYRLSARVSDMMHGWLDGKRGIPRLPAGDAPVAEPRPAADIGSEVALPGEVAPSGDAPGRTEPPAQPDTMWTPRIEVLVRQSRELVEDERIRFADDWSLLKRRSVRYEQSLDPLQAAVTALAENLNAARTRLSSADLGKRRLAEQDTGKRPDTLVNARRQSAWERRLRAAEEQHQAATARLAEASHGFRLYEDLIRERAEVARAAARRHHELALRRVATYLQQLMRSHPGGAELNEWFSAYRVGPDLPEWAKDSVRTESAIKQMLARDSPQGTVPDPEAGNETSGQ